MTSSQTTRRAITVTEFKSLKEHPLTISNDEPIAAPNDYEVQVEVRAVGLNFFDGLMVEGKYQIKPPFPFTPGSELAGVVIKCGGQVTRFKPGDRVVASLSYGAFATIVNVAEDMLFTVPRGMTFEEASAFIMVYATSYYGLIHRGKLQSTDTVLVHAAAGGVGLAAVQIAKALGCKVIGTAGSSEKCQVILDRGGADYAINYREVQGKALVAKVREYAPDGVDVVYDPVGGDMFDLSTSMLAFNGRLLVIGFAGGRIPSIPANRILLKSISVVGVFLGAEMMRSPDTFRQIMRSLTEMFHSGLIRPVIYPGGPFNKLESIRDALLALGSRKTFGKVVVSKL